MSALVPEFSGEITEAIARLRQLTRTDAIANWRYTLEDLPVGEATQPESWHRWAVPEIDDRGHIAWEAGRQTIWLGQTIGVPQQLHGYPLDGLTLRLALTWWAESAEIFINRELVHRGDLFDCNTRVVLGENVSPGETIAVAVRLVSPGHDRGALVRSHCIYETPYDNCIEPGFIADELEVIYKFIAKEPDGEAKFAAIAKEIAAIAWEALPEKKTFERSLSDLRENLQKIFHQSATIYLLGHAHLDLAWLWPIADTWDAAQRTFASALNLMEEFPKLTFCHSTAALYAWIEENRPDLFAGIQQQIAANRWEVVAGLWVEPELNIISGEAIARQLLYGQHYCLEKFGQVSPVAWLPDSFGFCWQLPQLLKLGGIEYFVTQKLRWNDTTKFPYDLFWWQSPDGTRILSFMSAPIGEGIDPIKMANYALEWEAKTGSLESLWLPGVGDCGGGPTRDMLEIGDRWRQSPFFPKLEFTTAGEYLGEGTGNWEWGMGNKQLSTIDDRPEDAINRVSTNPPLKRGGRGESSSPLPIWNDELYLEFHRGCYTSHADQKWWNRRGEGGLYEAELFASLATIVAGAEYPKAEIETAWKKVLFNQFHDILPGSAIPEVYVDADREWQAAKTMTKEIIETALDAIAAVINREIIVPPVAIAGKPIVIFNSLNWQRSQIVAIEVSEPAAGKTWQIYDSDGNRLRSQKTDSFLFETPDIPSIGYRVFWLIEEAIVPEEDAMNRVSTGSDDKFILENDKIRAIVNPETGNLSSIYDKTQQREILNGAGNQLQAFQDSGQYWDAWNIDPNYAQHPLPEPILKHIEWIELGELQQCLRIVRQLGQSEFIQDYIIEAHSPILKIATKVNWQERHVMVKAAFPLNVEADFATYEMPCGAIARTTKPQTPAEKAKWEVPALNWADLSGKEYGVSLLNDGKYGYDAQPQQLRLTLLRGSTWPDPNADFGWHEFTYAIYPHSGTWKSAQTVRRGYEWNLPLHVKVMDKSAEESPDDFPRVSANSFVKLSAENLVVMALKQSESNSQRWILRCYECAGESAELEIAGELGLEIVRQVDILERSVESEKELVEGEMVKIAPWQIASFELDEPLI